MNFGNKLKDWKDRLKDRHMFSLVIGSFIVILALLGYIIKIRNDNKQSLENAYNHAFYELASYIDNINNLLSKAQISKDPSHSAKTMSEIWRQVPRCRVYRILGIKLTGDTTNLPAIKNIRWFPTRLICTTQTVPDVLWRRGYDLVLCRPIVGPTPPKLPAFRSNLRHHRGDLSPFGQTAPTTGARI